MTASCWIRLFMLVFKWTLNIHMILLTRPNQLIIKLLSCSETGRLAMINVGIQLWWCFCLLCSFIFPRTIQATILYSEPWQFVKRSKTYWFLIKIFLIKEKQHEKKSHLHWGYMVVVLYVWKKHNIYHLQALECAMGQNTERNYDVNLFFSVVVF